MGWTKGVLVGLAELLADNDIGIWSPDGVYADADTAITITTVPASPERIVCLTAYDDISDPGGTEVRLMVQVRFRAGLDSGDVLDMADAVRDLLHGRRHLTLGTAPVAQIVRRSGGPIGPDALGRPEVTANYEIQTDRTTDNTE